MDTSDIVSVVLRGALGRSGRKRARRARNFLSGHAGFLSASTLMAAAGIVWGVYDSLKSQAAATSAAPAGPAPSTAGTPPMPVPPVPPSAGTPAGAAVSLPADVLRLIRLAVSASRADGSLSPQEREVILSRAQDAGVAHVVETELAQVRPLHEIVGGVAEAAQREDLYVLAFTIIRADETVTGAERIYLAQLAHQLGLDPATVARLEQDTAAKIDAAPDDTPAES